MQVEITEDCIACEMCVEICPEVFQMGDEFAELAVDEIPEQYEDLVRDAEQECPVDAIIVEED